MIKITIQYTKDEEMISAHCLRDEIKSLIKIITKIVVLNPEGEKEI